MKPLLSVNYQTIEVFWQIKIIFNSVGVSTMRSVVWQSCKGIQKRVQERGDNKAEVLPDQPLLPIYLHEIVVADTWRLSSIGASPETIFWMYIVLRKYWLCLSLLVLRRYVQILCLFFKHPVYLLNFCLLSNLKYAGLRWVGEITHMRLSRH